jgi:hypothetical protein
LTVELSVAGRAGVPHGADAVVLNVTAAESLGWGNVVAYRCGTTPPSTSNINFSVFLPAVANMIVAPLSSAGTVCLIVHNEATHLVADVSGYFPVGSSLRMPEPMRLLDTRPGAHFVNPGTDVVLQVTGQPGVPAEAETALINVTALIAEGDGYVTAHPCAEPASNSSNVNFTHQVYVRSNLVVAKLDYAGRVCLFVAGSPVNLIADLIGVAGRRNP